MGTRGVYFYVQAPVTVLVQDIVFHQSSWKRGMVVASFLAFNILSSFFFADVYRVRLSKLLGFD